MPRKHRPRAARPAPSSPPAPPIADEPPVRRTRDLADRRDVPTRDHANLGPDDRTSPRFDDIEAEGTERVPDVEAAVIEGGASEPDLH